MNRIEEHLRSIQYRTVGSMLIFVVFLGIAVALGVRGTTMQQQQMLFWIAPLVCAIVLLPREVYPTSWPRGENDDEQARIDMARTQLTQLHTRVLFTRVAYLVLVLIVVGFLPRLGV